MIDRADVAVVGAGIVGIAVAHYLTKDGRRVLFVDREDAARGASFGNAGALAFSDVVPLASPGIMRKAPGWLLDPDGPLSVPPAYALRIAPWLLRFWRASWRDRFEASFRAQVALMRLAAEEMNRLVAAAGLDSHVRSDGSLELYESDAELAEAEPRWRARQDSGIAFEHVRGTRLAELQPSLSPRFVAGTFVPQWKTVGDPYDFARALFDRAMSRGATFRKAQATAIVPEDGGLRIETQGGEAIHARQAVIACGAWSRGLAAGLGESVPLETERGYNTTLPAGAFDIRRQLIFGGHGFVITPLSTGIRVGGGVELGGLDAPPQWRRARAMLAKAAQFLPGLRTEGGREWMGFRPSIPDSLPVIGRPRGSGDVVLAFGHGHLGLTQSAATGRIVADLLAGRPTPIVIAPFAPARF